MVGFQAGDSHLEARVGPVRFTGSRDVLLWCCSSIVLSAEQDDGRLGCNIVSDIFTDLGFWPFLAHHVHSYI